MEGDPLLIGEIERAEDECLHVVVHECAVQIERGFEGPCVIR
jgi:hypothetical protein